MRNLQLGLAFLVTSVWPAFASTGLGIQGASLSVGVGQTVTVNAFVSGTADLYALQFDIAFTPGILLATSLAQGTFLSNAGPTAFLPGTIDNSRGTIALNSITLLGRRSGASGDGTLLTITFTAISSGRGSITVSPLSRAVLLDSTLNNIHVSGVGGVVITVNAPPNISQQFTPSKITPGSASNLSFTITDPDSLVSLVGVAFSDTLPAGVVVANPGSLTSNCGGTATAAAGSAVISLVGGAIASGGSCTVSVTVTGVSEGIYANAVTVTSTNNGTGNTSTATLFVAIPPIVSKAFGEVSIGDQSSTALTFTLINPNHIVTLTGLQLTDTLPAGLVVATPNGVTGTCDGLTITATAGFGDIKGGSTDEQHKDWVLVAQASCTFSVNVTANSAVLGLLTNTTGAVGSNEAKPSNPAAASIFVGDPFQISYAANLASADSFVDITNAGTSGAGIASQNNADPAATTGAICANVYAFTPDEQMVSCCSCPVTPNGLDALSVRTDLAANTLTPAVPAALVLKLLATIPTGGSCDKSAAAVNATSLANGMKSFRTTVHATPAPDIFAVTETPFAAGTLSAEELNRLASLCNFILANGSGFGVCRSCRLDGIGADRQ